MGLVYPPLISPSPLPLHPNRNGRRRIVGGVILFPFTRVMRRATETVRAAGETDTTQGAQIGTKLAL